MKRSVIKFPKCLLAQKSKRNQLTFVDRDKQVSGLLTLCLHKTRLKGRKRFHVKFMLLCPLSAPFRSDRVLLGVSLTACKAGDWTEMFSFNYKVNLKRSILFVNKSVGWKFFPFGAQDSAKMLLTRLYRRFLFQRQSRCTQIAILQNHRCSHSESLIRYHLILSDFEKVGLVSGNTFSTLGSDFSKNICCKVFLRLKVETSQLLQVSWGKSN